MTKTMMGIRAALWLLPCVFLTGCWLGYDSAFARFRIERGGNSVNEARPGLEWLMSRILEVEHYDCEQFADQALILRNRTHPHVCVHLEKDLSVGYRIDDERIDMEVRGSIRDYDSQIDALLASIEAANLLYTTAP